MHLVCGGAYLFRSRCYAFLNKETTSNKHKQYARFQEDMMKTKKAGTERGRDRDINIIAKRMATEKQKRKQRQRNQRRGQSLPKKKAIE